MTLNVIRSDIRAMNSYTIAQLSEDMIKLDAMEVPYLLPENLRRQLAEKLIDAPINRYPNPAASGLHDSLRKAFSIPEQAQIALGNGSDELIQLLSMLVAQPGSVMLSLDPSFVMYQRNATLFGMQHIGVALNDDFTLNVQAVLDAIKEHQPALIFLSYPNNPTGVPFKRTEIQSIIEAATGIIVIDEAYGAFCNDSFLEQAGQQENLVILRTLSKIGFAGLRLGYAAGHPAVIDELVKITPPYNINTLSLITAQFALENMQVVNENIEKLKNERARIINELEALETVQVYNSDANFVTIRLPNAATVFETLKNQKILVKNLSGSHKLLNNCLRLTIGTEEENDQVLAVISQYIKENQNIEKNNKSEKSKYNSLISFVVIMIIIAIFVAVLWLTA